MADPSPPCNGICLTAADVGVPVSGIAYPHPTCPAHGDAPDHPFEHAETDGHGHELCRCGAVREAHWEQAPCGHPMVEDDRCFDCGASVRGGPAAVVEALALRAYQRAHLPTTTPEEKP